MNPRLIGLAAAGVLLVALGAVIARPVDQVHDDIRAQRALIREQLATTRTQLDLQRTQLEIAQAQLAAAQQTLQRTATLEQLARETRDV
ncbi:MAG: hypothetical protein QOD70_2332, partial [Frankiales bacterium]|nr:hypothetical protein [Frankiales bacterium]